MFTGIAKTINPMDERSEPSTPADSVSWRVTGADKERIKMCRSELQALLEVRRRCVARHIDTEEIDRQIVVFYTEIEEVLDNVSASTSIKKDRDVP